MRKNFIFAVFAAALLVSCAPYHQIATVSSLNLFKNKTGHYESTLSDKVVVSYDFWAQNGKLFFTVWNNSSEDVYLDLEHSFFVKDFQAFDYYKGRTYVKPVQIVSEDDAEAGIFEKRATETIQVSEKSLVCIPANSYKTFSEFSLMNSVYVSDDLNDRPRKHQSPNLNFRSSNSPLSFENRLSFVIDGEVRTLHDVFFISNIQNSTHKNACPKSVDDKGNTIRTSKYMAPNKFYILYEPAWDSQGY